MKLNYKKGFTLIELLVVIAIIGILASIVLTSLNSAKTKGSRTATLATLKGIVPELINCADSGGYANVKVGTAANVATGSPVAGQTICITPTSATTAVAAVAMNGHTATWPALPSGSAYAASTNATSALSAYTYTYGATVTSATAISCSIATGSCQ